ncbi:hypothetical protein HDU99_004970, partial [Rhizoclosmatium hyalinum]
MIAHLQANIHRGETIPEASCPRCFDDFEDNVSVETVVRHFQTHLIGGRTRERTVMNDSDCDQAKDQAKDLEELNEDCNDDSSNDYENIINHPKLSSGTSSDCGGLFELESFDSAEIQPITGSETAIMDDKEPSQSNESDIDSAESKSDNGGEDDINQDITTEEGLDTFRVKRCTDMYLNKVYAEFADLLDLLSSDPAKQFELQMYSHCMKRKVTHAEYYELIHMEMPDIDRDSKT